MTSYKVSTRYNTLVFLLILLITGIYLLGSAWLARADNKADTMQATQSMSPHDLFLEQGVGIFPSQLHTNGDDWYISGRDQFLWGDDNGMNGQIVVQNAYPGKGFALLNDGFAITSHVPAEIIISSGGTNTAVSTGILGQPDYLARSGSTLYVGSSLAPIIKTFTTAGIEGASINLGSNASALLEAGGYIWALHGSSISRIQNTAVNKTTALGSDPTNLSTDGTNYVAVLDSTDSTTHIVEISTGNVVGTVSTLSPVEAIFANNNLYVVTSTGVEVVSLTTYAITDTISLTEIPVSAAQVNGKLYVSYSSNTAVSVVNLTTNTVEATIMMPASAIRLAATTNGILGLTFTNGLYNVLTTPTPSQLVEPAFAPVSGNNFNDETLFLAGHVKAGIGHLDANSSDVEILNVVETLSEVHQAGSYLYGIHNVDTQLSAYHPTNATKTDILNLSNEYILQTTTSQNGNLVFALSFDLANFPPTGNLYVVDGLTKTKVSLGFIPGFMAAGDATVFVADGISIREYSAAGLLRSVAMPGYFVMDIAVVDGIVFVVTSDNKVHSVAPNNTVTTLSGLTASSITGHTGYLFTYDAGSNNVSVFDVDTSTTTPSPSTITGLFQDWSVTPDGQAVYVLTDTQLNKITFDNGASLIEYPDSSLADGAATKVYAGSNNVFILHPYSKVTVLSSSANYALYLPMIVR